MIRTDGRIGLFAPARPASIGTTLAIWYETWRQRRELATLDARILQDVGLSPEDARQEASRPFWDIDPV